MTESDLWLEGSRTVGSLLDSTVPGRLPPLPPPPLPSPHRNGTGCNNNHLSQKEDRWLSPPKGVYYDQLAATCPSVEPLRAHIPHQHRHPASISTASYLLPARSQRMRKSGSGSSWATASTATMATESALSTLGEFVHRLLYYSIEENPQPGSLGAVGR